MDARVAEGRENIWMLFVAPGIWAVHFMLCYVTAAVWCAKAPSALEPLGAIRTTVFVYTVLALGAIAVVGWMGYRAHTYGSAPLPHDEDTPEDRHRFMGFATLLLAGLSGLAVVYAALVAVFVETCQ